MTQAAAESNGVFTRCRRRIPLYLFHPCALGLRPTTTHTIGIYGSRNLTEFDLGTNYASTTFNFVPNGSRGHPGARCHSNPELQSVSRPALLARRIAARHRDVRALPHSADNRSRYGQHGRPASDGSQDPHGSELPSVQAGKPYQIIGYQGSVNDYSTVVHPSDPRRCEVCHEQNSGARRQRATSPGRHEHRADRATTM